MTPEVKEIINNIHTNPDMAIAAVIELLNQTEYALEDYSWYDGERYVDGSTAPEDEYGARISAEVRRKLNLSWNMIIYDYFGREEN